MNIKEIIVPSPSGDVFTVLASSESGHGRPLVILCHGLMMNCSQNPVLGVSDGFNDAGYDTLRMDFRGSGRSSGEIMEMTPVTETIDLLTVVKYITEYPDLFCGHSRIVLCGHSLGGLVSLLAASAISGGTVPGLDYDGSISADCLAGLVLLAPAVNIEADSKAGRVATVTFDPANIPECVEVWGSCLSKKYFLAARSLDTFSTISAYHGAACVLLGERDRIVELDLADKIKAALPQAELHVIPHGDHLFSRGVRLKAVDIALEFLSRM